MCVESLVTVILPTKDRLELLKRAVNSVLKQNHSSIELIIVDDGSSDGTQDYLQQLSDNYRNVVVILNEASQGACVSRNKAIKSASGNYITCMDDDDYLKPNHISNLLSYFSDGYSCVSANMARLISGKEKSFAYYTGEVNLDNHFYYNRLGNHVFTFTDRLKEIGGFDEQFPAFQDYECWTRLLKEYGPAYRVPECTYMLDNQHQFERISSSSARKVAGLDMFMFKHSQDIKPKHKKSLLVLRKRFLNEKIKLYDAISGLNISNYKFIVSSYLSKFR